MKKTIHGKRYDTEKAIKIGSCSRGSVGDLEYWEATLYRTPRSRQYFLAGKGGPMSRFAQQGSVNEWSGGSDLIPLTPDEALEWAKQYLDAKGLRRMQDLPYAVKGQT